MMRRLTLLLALCGLAYPQVADKANERYKSKEGRDAISRTLDAHDRDNTQKPVELIAALEIKPGMTVADIGTGTGYMLPYLSKAVGAGGKVLAEDIFPDFLDRARDKARKANLENVTFVQGTEKDPRLPAEVDLVLVLDAYHHFDWPEDMMKAIGKSLRPAGRVAIVDFFKAGFRDPEHIRLDRDDVIREIESYGFRAVLRRVHTPDRQYMVIFEKK